MARPTFINTFGEPMPTDLLARAQRLAAAHVPQLAWANNVALQTVFRACADNPGVFPLTPKNDLDEYIAWWLQKYADGLARRPSLRSGGLVTTTEDAAVRIVLEARSGRRGEQLNELTEGHRLAMAAENIVGDLLEEYVADHVAPRGWYCAWGSTMRDIDFCSRDGVLLQVKNRDNSENNASRRVRAGTQIRQWHRSKAHGGATLWPRLAEIVGEANLSEEGFLGFVRATMTNNRALLAV